MNLAIACERGEIHLSWCAREGNVQPFRLTFGVEVVSEFGVSKGREPFYAGVGVTPEGVAQMVKGMLDYLDEQQPGAVPPWKKGLKRLGRDGEELGGVY